MFEFVILGSGAGAVYALLGQGIVLIFRGSGILNIAHGSIAMLAAFVTTTLRLEAGWGGTEAILLGVLMAVAIGVLIDVAVLQRLTTASPLTRVIATLAVFLVIYSFGIIQWTHIPGVARPLFPSGPIDILGATVPQDRLWTLGVAVLLTLGLTAVWRWTRIGWVTEAVAENERSAAALGISPRLVSIGTWAAGAGVAGLAGAIIAPLTQLTVAGMSLLVIPALAAALIGGFRSYMLTLAGGLVIGVGQSLAGAYTDITGAADALPLLVIVGILVARGTGLPLRGHTLDRLPRVGSGRVNRKLLVISLALMALVLVAVTSNLWLTTISATLAIAVILLSVVVLTGYAGQLSLAQFALAGVGALISAHLVSNIGAPFELAMVAGMGSAIIAGMLFALPALRTRGVNLAVVTLGLGLAMDAVVFRNNDFTGGVSGIPVEGQTFLGIDIDVFAFPTRYAALALLAFAVSALLVANIRRGRSGRRLLAVRANERSAASLGVSVYAVKVYAFAVSGALAGLGGVLIAFQASSATFTGYVPLSSILAVAQAVIGGVAYVLGPVIGAQLSHSSWSSIIAIEWSDVDKYLPLVGGAVLILNLMIAPDGLANHIKETKDGLLARLRGRIGRGAEGESAASEDELGEAVRIGRVPASTLRVDGLSVRFGSVKAVDEVSLNVASGEVVGLIGPNGAGKTSLLDAVTGFVDSSGDVALDDVSLEAMPPYERARSGMIRSFQGLELFEDLTVRENLLCATDDQSVGPYVSDLVRPGSDGLPPAADAAVRQFELRESLDMRPDELPLGRQRLVAIARAVAARPSVILLDEPAAGLDESETRDLGLLVRQLADDWGMGVMVIEHDMSFVMETCDRIVVLEFGREIARGTPDEVKNDPRALEAYLGTSMSPMEPADADTGGEGGGASGGQ